ncbi:MAG: hypothetical protein JJU36_01600 [Phycisphaeraceae bacterium]|nr:hypothetical protein [Phycisphaeraceae bacterium]
MNIGLDINGTITECPEFFSLLSHALRQAGHRVFIVTYRDPDITDCTRQELEEYGVSFDDIYFPRDEEHLPDFKARIADELELDLFIDDMPETFMAMPAKVKRLWLCDPAIYDLRRITSG